jgi:hypothetical protein
MFNLSPLKPLLNKKSQPLALFLDYRTGEWVETIPQYLMDMIVARLTARGYSKGDALRVASLGWGVQSTRLVFGAALSEIYLDFAVHSDTTYETESTYNYAKQWVNWLLERGFPVITTKEPIETQLPIVGGNVQHVPIFNINEKGKVGRLKRQCTTNWKIKPTKRVIAMVMAYLGITKRPGSVQTILGISKDEWSRASSSGLEYVINCFPLLQQDFDRNGVSSKLLPKKESRDDCIQWLINHGFAVPTKSACYHCSYKRQSQWVEMKIENGSDWKNAVAFDLAIRDKSPKYGQLFIHRSATPLAKAVKTPEELGYSQAQMLVEDDATCSTAGYCEFVPSK